ncbi:dienelactone hydrolase family protein [Candidatus Curtissbacteria bacterium]|nr:dienelactone hydrolase family protein [Candidatus Curtissbacteria bacterium]
MKKILFLVTSAVLLSILFFIFNGQNQKLIKPTSDSFKEKPLDKYSFENLASTTFKPSQITFGKVIKDEIDFTSIMFYFFVDNKKVSGLANIPKKEGSFPIIVMFRGYVPQETYQTGIGTEHSGEVFAQNGLITLAPDFLGFGESDKPSENSIEERFQTYSTALTLLESIKNLNQALETNDSLARGQTDKIGIWGHSNGGQIAISTLEITGKSYPTILWAPVSKPFPYSILYFTDEFDDHGKALRKIVADFEKDYDIEKYSPTNFFGKIDSPIQLHQGSQDEAVPQKWSDQLKDNLEKLDKSVEYFVYPQEDHNFAKGSWPTVIQRSINFYKEQLL